MEAREIAAPGQPSQSGVETVTVECGRALTLGRMTKAERLVADGRTTR